MTSYYLLYRDELIEKWRTPWLFSRFVQKRMLGMAVDITERKQVEDALKKSEEKFSKAFRQSPLMLTLTSVKDGRFVEVKRQRVAVGTPITRRPPRRSVQAVLPHTALTLDSGAKDTRRTSRNPWDTRTPALCRERVRSNDVSPWSTPFPPQPPRKTSPRCSAGSSVSGRRWRACTLATVRRSNCTDGFPVCSFHEESEYRDANEGTNRTRFTGPYA